MTKFSDLQNNPNLWTSFSIEYAEIWEGSGEAVYEQDLIDGCNPFSGLINTDFDEGLDDWDQVAPSGSGTFSQWNTGLPPITSYYLDLIRINEDLLEIPQSEKVYQVPATGDFEFGVRLRVSSQLVTGGIIGYGAATGAGTLGSSRWGFVRVTNDLQFISGNVPSNGGAFIGIVDFFNTYDGQIVDIKAGWYGNETRIYVNNSIEVTSTLLLRPTDITANPNFSFKIGGYTDSSGTVPINFINADIYSFFIDDDVFEVNEGAGFPTVSNLGTIATGSTTNTGGLTYWNNNVWQPE